MMKQKHTLWRAPLLLCSAAFLTLPGASLAQTMQDQQKQPAAQSQQQAPAATQSQAPATQPQGSGASQSGAQPQTQGQAPSSAPASPNTAQQPSQNRNAQSPQGTGQQQTQSPAPSGTQTTQQPQQGGTATQQQTQTPRSTQQPSTAQQPSATGQATGQSSGQTATLTDQQRTKISTSISQANVQPVRNVNFAINVGTVVPSSIRFYPVTRAMIDVYPQFRGYHFMVVNEEIVIVEPRSRKIVQVIHHQGGGGQATLRSKLKLSDKQRNVIRSSVRRPGTSTTTTGSSTTIEKEITIGDTLPETVVIERFPDTVYRSVPSIRTYQYITRDRGVYVIDPRERRVIDLID